ncbi:MAG TPA: hypothetical protein DCF68_00580 [Cyanothece sp. UBA12306]|nr:hypothetical protein [Cyanothece sp. UBA12306]
MDITDSTKSLITHVQSLKSHYDDLASLTFIDFYCQCREGCDYLFAQKMKQSVRVFDILMWFFQCLEAGSKITIIELMWRDVIGPTLEEYQQDRRTEKQLEQLFTSTELKQSVLGWDRQPRGDGGVNLILRNLLQDIENIEAQHPPKNEE